MKSYVDGKSGPHDQSRRFPSIRDKYIARTREDDPRNSWRWSYRLPSRYRRPSQSFARLLIKPKPIAIFVRYNITIECRSIKWVVLRFLVRKKIATSRFQPGAFIAHDDRSIVLRISFLLSSPRKWSWSNVTLERTRRDAWTPKAQLLRMATIAAAVMVARSETKRRDYKVDHVFRNLKFLVQNLNQVSRKLAWTVSDALLS